jgi:hypothetical protein
LKVVIKTDQCKIRLSKDIFSFTNKFECLLPLCNLSTTLSKRLSSVPNDKKSKLLLLHTPRLPRLIIIIPTIVIMMPPPSPESRTYSVLTAQDFEKLCPYIKDWIHVNNDQLTQSIPDQTIPSAFLSMLTISRLVSSRRNEMGTRKITNVFLDVAVYIARQIFHEERLVVIKDVELCPLRCPKLEL